MRLHFRWSAALALLLFVAGAAHADPIIWNTGINSSGAVAPDLSLEQHYTVTPGGPAQVDSSLSATPGSNTTSVWIRPNSNLGPGTYFYETTFTWPAASPITITGQWAAYASGADIRLNGISTGDSIADPGYLAWHPFTITGNALTGTNSLAFLPASAGGPTGLRVEIFSVVPEPASLGWVGCVCFAAAMRRRGK